MRVAVRLCVLTVLLPSLALSQAKGFKTDETDPTHGAVIGNTYVNESIGFWFPIPEGWQVKREQVGTDRENDAKLSLGGGMELLVLDQRTVKPFATRIILTALNAASVSMTTREYVSKLVGAQVGHDGQVLVRDAAEVELAGKQFIRADYKQVVPDGSRAESFVCAKIGAYFVGWTFVAGAPEELETLVNWLRHLSFQGGSPVTVGIISNRPPVGAAPPQKIRVSPRVSAGMLVQRIDPEYPEEALRKHIAGSVTLSAVIDKNGDVQELSVVSGPSLLVPATLDAVRQWKYKPYLLQGQPLAMETVIIVDFFSPPPE